MAILAVNSSQRVNIDISLFLTSQHTSEERNYTRIEGLPIVMTLLAAAAGENPAKTAQLMIHTRKTRARVDMTRARTEQEFNTNRNATLAPEPRQN